jgi:hypothetical protein
VVLCVSDHSVKTDPKWAYIPDEVEWMDLFWPMDRSKQRAVG